MKRSFLITILTICLLLSGLIPAVSATETAETVAETEEAAMEETMSTATSGICGDGLSWKLEDGVLTVSGSGAMDAGCPWEAHKDSIRKVVLTGGVTAVGEGAFADCDNLTVIDFGGALKEIDTRAFYDCDALTEISVPATFRRFGVESFRDCTNLTAVYCAGGMPSFNGNCLWNGNHVTVYTPVNNPWPQEHVEVLVNNFGGRLEVVAGGESMYTYTEPTTPPPPTEIATEPPTEPTTEPTTEPATEPAAEPVTEPATQPAQSLEPETTAALETEPADTQEAGEQTIVERAGTSGWVWMLLVAAGLTVLLVLALIIRMITHKDGKFTD